jgi:cob(I)alamin adenosyltransferase
VAIVGCGALGSVVAMTLVRAGVGFVRIIDRDVPELSNLPRQVLFDEADVAESEAWIDEVDAANPPLRTFVMPAGTELAARLHVARTVSRRTERTIISLGSIEPVGEPLLRYMNRLSDLFFAMARRANHERGHPDVPWTPKPVK